MFKNNPLLLQLKEGLVAEVKSTQPLMVEGTIRGTYYAYGFLVTAQGDSYFVSPPEMSKCLPGDVVTAQINQKEDGKTDATILSIITPLTGTFIGTVRFRGPYAMIAPENAQIKNWFRIPQIKRDNERDGDIVVANILQHPFETGAAQAEILSTITHERDRQAYWRLASARHNIPYDPPVFDHDDVPTQSPDQNTIDLRGLGFVTIDGEYTRDIDDALYAKRLDNNRIALMVAIADADRFLTPGGSMETSARARGFTAYYPGISVSMLPKVLSEQGASLVEGEDRNVICCEMTLEQDGSISHVQFFPALIHSHGKLSYEAVEAFLDGDTASVNLDNAPVLDLLNEAAKRRGEWRSLYALNQSGFSDYRFNVEDFELKNIECIEQSPSQKLVEECMVAANISFANLMHQQGLPCIYRHHPGLKPDRLDDLVKKLSAQGISTNDPELKTIEGFKDLMRRVAKDNDPAVNALLISYFERSAYTLEYRPHFTLGLEGYATFTSPIRKFSDLANYRQLKNYLLGTHKPVAIDQELVDHLNHQLHATNRASSDVKQALYARFYLAKIGTTVSATLVNITSKVVIEGHEQKTVPTGIRLKIKETGLTTFISAKNLTRRGISLSISEDGLSLLQNGAPILRLAQEVSIKIESVDMTTRSVNVLLGQ